MPEPNETLAMPVASNTQAGPTRARRLGARDRWIVAGLLGAAAALIAYKLSGFPGSGSLAAGLSFEHLPPEMRARTHHLLFTPLGALIVVFARITLGIRVLGPFRSVLLAIAFQVTGSLIGVAFFALVIGVVVVLRPVLKRMKLPYFGRSAAMLAAVAGMIVLAMLVGLALGWHEVERIAYFPVVVLTLAGDAFAMAIRREGWRSAVWRATATVVVALLIASLASIRVLQDALVRYPELVLATLAGIVIVCEYLNMRLFQHLNPAPVKKKKAKKAAPAGAAVLPPARPADAARPGAV
jgi:hypothetical protein